MKRGSSIGSKRGGLLVEVLVGAGILVGIVVALGQIESVSASTSVDTSRVSVPTFGSPGASATEPGAPDSSD